ncbi:MAG: aspartate/glutamate racemase family protein [bacterium]|nr:aspartate/glutamate racemase family protein [bacterium]
MNKEKKWNKNKTIGILGGMGPEATLFFYQKIIDLTPAKKDQEHIPVLIYSNTSIPDRTTCILNKDDSIIQDLQYSAKTLENSGASLIVIPCNTAHYWITKIQSSVSVPVLNMIKETGHYIKKNTKATKTGLLSSTGTVKTKIFQHNLKEYDIEVVSPEKDTQSSIMEVIKNIKSGALHKKNSYIKQRAIISSAIEEFQSRGIFNIILGCTEISLLFRESCTSSMLKIDSSNIIFPMNIIAKKAVHTATIQNDKR